MRVVKEKRLLRRDTGCLDFLFGLKQLGSKYEGKRKEL